MIFLDLPQQSNVSRRGTDLQQKLDQLVTPKYHQQQQQQQVESGFCMNGGQHNKQNRSPAGTTASTSSQYQPASSNHYNANPTHENYNNNLQVGKNTPV